MPVPELEGIEWHLNGHGRTSVFYVSKSAWHAAQPSSAL
jgi:hypothetical protein